LATSLKYEQPPAAPWQVEFHDDLMGEVDDLPRDAQTVLAEFGPALGRASADTLKGSRIANLKELRFSTETGVWRVTFAFDRQRVASCWSWATSVVLQRTASTGPCLPKAEARWKTRGG